MFYDLNIDLTTLARASMLPISEGELLNTQMAVQRATQLAQQTWSQYISGVNVTWSGGSFVINTVSGRYQQEVMQGYQYPVSGSKLWGAVVVGLDYADLLERGISSFNIAGKMLKGRAYINVPFDQTNKTIPNVIRKNIQGGRLRNTRIGAGGLTTFSVGQRSKLAPQELGMQPYTWRAGSFAGLQRSGGGGLMTFRRISDRTAGNAWQHPGITPKPVTRAVAENIHDQVEDLITSGFKADLNVMQKNVIKVGKP